MKVLITGITGFVGSHLSEYLLEEGHEVHGVYRWRSKLENISHIQDRINLVPGDIRDGYSLQTVLRNLQPDILFHLAAQSFVLESWNSPLETLSTNILGTTNVLEAARWMCPKCRIVVAGSSEEYGLVPPNETPIKESNPLRPMSPYGVSKVATDNLGILYNMSYGLNVVVTRCFNHTGPRRGEVFATSSFAKQIAEIERSGKKPVIHVGNLEAFRDWTDVRDITKAYWLAATKCIQGEVYNICSGKAIGVGDMLGILLSMSEEKIKVVHDPARMRPSDVPILLGNYDKFRDITGWRPEIPLQKTLRDLLNYWRARV